MIDQGLDFHYFRERICCGFVFRGLLGEMMVDSRLIQRCPRHDPHQPEEPEDLPLTVESLIESELRKLAEKKSSEPEPGVKEVERSESDEGFYDKSSTVTGPASPDSCETADIGLED